MTISKYLRIVGWFELIATAIGIVFGLIYVIALSTGAGWALAMHGSAGEKAIAGSVLFLTWVLFLAGCFFAPAIGVLFIAVADLLDGEPSTSVDVSSAIESKLAVTKSRLNKLEQSVEALNNGFNSKNVFVDSNSRADNGVGNSLSKEKNSTNEIFSAGPRRAYEIDTKIRFRKDMLINGISIKRGDAGVIVDILLGFGGRQYVVILSDSKERVSVQDDCFE